MLATDPPGGVLDLNVNLHPGGGRIGDFPHVVGAGMDVCRRTPDGSDASCTSSDTGVILQLGPTDKLKVHLTNTLDASSAGSAHCMDYNEWDTLTGWRSTNGQFNLHYHGFLTRPTKTLTPGGGAPLYGDYIFDCTGRTPAAPDFTRFGTVVGPTMDYAIDLADFSANLAGASVRGQPLGLNWFHPHVHGIAKAEVALGLVGMIAVGEPKDYLCIADPADPSGCRSDPAALEGIRVRNMLLRDAQIVEVNGTRFNWANQEPDFCGPNKFDLQNFGGCAGDAETVKGLDPSFSAMTPADLAAATWLFTINGQRYPDVTVAEGGTEIWRIQNASANVTYRLSLRRVANMGVVGARMPFGILNMDGAGLSGSAQAGTVTNAEEVVLMPGSRAELLVRYDPAVDGCVAAEGACPSEDAVYQLVDDAFQAGFVAEDADTWPRVALAKVVFQAPVAVAAAAAPAAPADGLPHAVPSLFGAAEAGRGPGSAGLAGLLRVRRAADPDMQRAEAAHSMGQMEADMRALERAGASRTPSRSQLKQLERTTLIDKIVDNCQMFGAKPSVFVNTLDLSTTPGLRRRIYFAIGEDSDRKEDFVLGTTIVARGADGSETERTLDGKKVSDANPVILSQIDMMTDKTNICVLKGAYEQWELVNVSPEVHNFHIHQSKFTVHRDQTGAPVMRAPSPIDRQLLPASLLFKAGQLDVQHDTIIVPRAVSSCDSSKLEEIPPAAGASAMTMTPRRFLFRPSGCRPQDRGSILIDISFAGPQFQAQKGRQAKFVYHCHILEHEDNGMMGSITVIDNDKHS